MAKHVLPMFGLLLLAVGCGDSFSNAYLSGIDATAEVVADVPAPDVSRPPDADTPDGAEPDATADLPSSGDIDTCEPVPELCNGIDDDCDGETDEDFSDLGAACDGEDSGACEGGQWVCSEDGTGLNCDEAAWPDCSSEDPCVLSNPVEDPQTCVVTCEETAVVPCCGNGVIEEGESCDGDCPTSCDDGIACTTDTLTGSAESCTAVCANEIATDPGTDSDGDALTDCQESTDSSGFTNPQVFNGMLATIGEPPTGVLSSAQCDLFFGNNFGEMWALFDDSNQEQNIWQGWNYEAGTTDDYSSTADFDFEPNWSNSDNTGVYSSFQILFRAQILLTETGTHCFSVDTGAGGIGPGDIAGRRNNCGRVYLDFTDSSLPIAETGYGSNESPNTGCVQASAGVHDIALAARHYETYFYAPKFQVRHCFGGGSECVPDQELTREIMHAWGACTPSCDGKTCGDDGCGGTCGSCPDGQVCAAGSCSQPCTPSCEGKACGDDGCGGNCGMCAQDEVCNLGQCEPGTCTPNCAGKDCGDDGCGGTCGDCPGGQSCNNGTCADAPQVCGDGTVATGEFCDDGNTETESPPDASSLPAGACISDCSIQMDTCGDGNSDPTTGEQCDDGNDDDGDTCTSSCLVSDDNIGDACFAEGVDADEVDYTAGTIVGCDNVPATFGGCVRACLRSIDPGFGQPLVHNPGGYCTLLAIKCEGGFACGFAPQPGDFDTCTACPDGYKLEEVVTNAAGSTITSRSCLRTCETQADCRWRQWDSRFNEWGQYQCLPSKSDASVNICQDIRTYGP